ncbi:MAG: hypothetical protein M3153_09940 [Chloroflexota bacterium]|nr:hypothetical protein [Chloroflexota bacterium]
MSARQQLDTQEKYRKEMQGALEKMIEDTIRSSAIPNTLAWVGVVVGSFVINLALLVLVTGG